MLVISTFHLFTEGGAGLHGVDADDTRHRHQFTSEMVLVAIHRDDTALVYTGPQAVANGQPQAVTAVLSDPQSQAPLAGKTVTFTFGSVTASATTDATGTAAATHSPWSCPRDLSPPLPTRAEEPHLPPGEVCRGPCLRAPVARVAASAAAGGHIIRVMVNPAADARSGY
jgi:hypothetical protein